MKPEDSERLLIEELFKNSKKRSPGLENTFVTDVQKLTGDASTRRYYRVTTNKESYVSCLGERGETTEHSNFVIMQELLSENGLRVPKILDKNITSGYLLEEDLGNQTLLMSLAVLENLTEELTTYKNVIDMLIDIHKIKITGEEDYSKLKFDENKLLQELNLTKKYFINGYLSYTLNSKEEAIFEKAMREICLKISEQKMCLTHRDFHARNLMVKNDELVIIDFQDARRGIPQYDLVSLLEDCYYDINVENKQTLKRYYWDCFLKDQEGQSSYEEYLNLYDLMTIQRTLKAIGSFSYIYKLRGDNRYLKYISFGYEKVKNILYKYENLTNFRKLLGSIYYES